LAAARGLVGRGDEAAAVRAVVGSAVSEGRLCGAVIEGAAGMGASVLARLAIAAGVEEGAQVLHARADPVQRATPGGVALAAGWMAEGGTASDVVAAIAARAERSPVVVVLEHLHDADPVTVAALQQAVARLASARVAIVVTTRDASLAPGAALVADIVDTGGPFLRLRPLDEDRLVELAERELGATCGPTLRTLLRQAGGMPLAAIELVAGLVREGRIRYDGTVADVDTEDLPESLRDGLSRFLGGVPRPAIDVLQVAAAMGFVVDVADLALVLGRPVADVLRDVAAAGTDWLVAHEGSVMWFRHELVHDALYESTSPAVRAALHAEIAAVLAAAGKPPALLARHVVAADGAAPVAVAADVAWALRRESPTLALDVTRVALDAGVVDSALRDRLETAALWPLLVGGSLAETESRARALLGRHHDPALDAELTWCVVAALQRQGRVAEARDELVRLVERQDLDPADRVVLLARLPVAHTLTGDTAAAEECSEDLLSDPALADHPDVAVGARVAQVFARLARGDVAEANAISREIARRLDEEPPSSREGMGIIAPTTLVEADRFDEARAALADAALADAGRGDRSVVSVYDVWLVVVDALSGAWDDAVAAGDAVRRAVTAEGGTAITALYALAYPAVVCVHRDALDRAEELISVGERTLETHGPQNGADVVLWARALLLEARGSPGDAVGLLGLEWDLTASVRYFHSWRSVAPDLVRLALATGDRDRATAVTIDAEEGARRAAEVPSARGAALRCRGLLDGDPDVLAAACTALRSSPRRPDLMAAAEDAAVALNAVAGGARRRAEAVALLSEARSLAEALGARRDLRRLDSRLSSLGAAPRRIRRDAAASGWESLTARETEVAALVAEGLTNPQIAERLVVSRHTIESHLKRIFLKVGATSRSQLAAEALRRANT
jgi:DNA-binding CsgD family transcriptional regulator